MLELRASGEGERVPNVRWVNGAWQHNYSVCPVRRNKAGLSALTARQSPRNSKEQPTQLVQTIVELTPPPAILKNS